MPSPSVPLRDGASLSTQQPRQRPWILWTLFLATAAFIGLLVTDLRVPIGDLAWFLVFVAAIPYAIGALILRVFVLDAGLDRFEAGVVSIAAGLLATGSLAMVGSVVGGATGVRVLLVAIAATSWVLRLRSPRKPARPSDWIPTAIVVVVLSGAHFALMPGRFTGFDPDGTLRLAGFATDATYLPFAFVILRDGGLTESVMYAGQPMLFHHFGSMFMIAANWLFWPSAVNPFLTRGLMHFLAGAPLLIALFTIVARRWTRSIFWTAVAVLTLLLPITAYPNRGRSEGIESLNGFWVQGLHGDINYLFGLIGVMLLILLLDVHLTLEKSLRPLAGILVLVAITAQVKFNLLLGYGPAATALVLVAAFRRGGWRGMVAVGAAGAAALMVVMGVAWFISGAFAGRGIGFDYGLVARDTLLSVLTGNAPDGLAPLIAAAAAVPRWLEPVAIVVIYCLAYTPLFAVMFLYPLRRPAPIDAFLLGTAATSAFLVLCIIEAGADRPQAWNISMHLHYLIPILAAAAIARLLAPGAWLPARWLAGAAALAIVGWCAYGVTIGAKSFFIWGMGDRIDREIGAMLRDIDRTTPLDAVILVPRGKLGVDDSVLPLVVRRTVFLSENFIFAGVYADTAARQRVIADVGRRWPAVPHVNLDGVQGLRGRALVLIGKVEVGDAPPPGARCHGQYCFWLPDLSGDGAR